MTEDAGALVRVFDIRGDAEARQLYEFLKQRDELAKRGKFFRVVVSEYAPQRRREQNARMWVGTLTPMEKQAKLNGHPIPAKSWHMIMKVMFLPEVCAKGVSKWKYLDSGDRELTMSTGDLNEEEHDAYMHEVNAYATNDLGVLLPANPRDLQGA